MSVTDCALFIPGSPREALTEPNNAAARPDRLAGRANAVASVRIVKHRPLRGEGAVADRSNQPREVVELSASLTDMSVALEGAGVASLYLLQPTSASLKFQQEIEVPTAPADYDVDITRIILLDAGKLAVEVRPEWLEAAFTLAVRSCQAGLPLLASYANPEAELRESPPLHGSRGASPQRKHVRDTISWSWRGLEVSAFAAAATASQPVDLDQPIAQVSISGIDAAISGLDGCVTLNAKLLLSAASWSPETAALAPLLTTPWEFALAVSQQPPVSAACPEAPRAEVSLEDLLAGSPVQPSATSVSLVAQNTLEVVVGDRQVGYLASAIAAWVGVGTQRMAALQPLLPVTAIAPHSRQKSEARLVPPLSPMLDVVGAVISLSQQLSVRVHVPLVLADLVSSRSGKGSEPFLRLVAADLDFKQTGSVVSAVRRAPLASPAPGDASLDVSSQVGSRSDVRISASILHVFDFFNNDKPGFGLLATSLPQHVAALEQISWIANPAEALSALEPYHEPLLESLRQATRVPSPSNHAERSVDPATPPSTSSGQGPRVTFALSPEPSAGLGGVSALPSSPSATARSVRPFSAGMGRRVVDVQVTTLSFTAAGRGMLAAVSAAAAPTRESSVDHSLRLEDLVTSPAAHLARVGGGRTHVRVDFDAFHMEWNADTVTGLLHFISALTSVEASSEVGVLDAETNEDNVSRPGDTTFADEAMTPDVHKLDDATVPAFFGAADADDDGSVISTASGSTAELRELEAASSGHIGALTASTALYHAPSSALQLSVVVQVRALSLSANKEHKQLKLARANLDDARVQVLTYAEEEPGHNNGWLRVSGELGKL
jgi:hypothetical protein